MCLSCQQREKNLTFYFVDFFILRHIKTMLKLPDLLIKKVQGQKTLKAIHAHADKVTIELSILGMD